MADESTTFREIPGLDGVGVVRHAGPPPTGARHAHRSVCVCAVLSGVRIVSCAGARCEAWAGNVLVLPAGLPHTCAGPPSEYVAISIPPACFERGGLVADVPGPMIVDDPVRFGAVLHLSELAGGGASLLERQGALLAVMEPLCGSGPPQSGPPSEPERIAQVRRRLESNCAEDLPLEALADMAGLSPCRLNRAFAAAVGMPPHEYQILQRVQRAKECIRQGLELARCAAEAGFSDQSHMTRCFRKVMGMTPGTFAAGVTRIR
ncbi:MAG: helix-turn-helix domain-containing protein [Pseudodesulfovibrio sp.]|uniref:helix-turn-helix domain-containing protein n=1 Tax=Pseudodesulfovibrio sp. TaxID=2035812 RepID=UPI003D0C2D4C